MAIAEKVTPRAADTTAFGKNMRYEGLEWMPKFRPDYELYIFNISQRTFKGFGAGKFGPYGIAVPGVEDTDPTEVLDIEGNKQAGTEGQRYRYFTSVPHPVMISAPNLEANNMRSVPTDGRRYVVDMINPDNLTLSLDLVVPEDQVWSQGNNYAVKGVFFDYTRIPSAIQLKKAYDRMEGYYNSLLERANVLELTDKAKLSEALAGNPDFAFAASYFGKEVSWNKKQTRPVECPNCGEKKPVGRRFHQTSFGSLCIEQSQEAWKAAVNSGVKRYEDVPDDFQWKKSKIDKLAAQLPT